MHHKQPTTLAVKIRIVLIFLVLLIISLNTKAQQTPVKVLIKMDKRSQYGFKYHDTLWFMQRGKLIRVKKKVLEVKEVK